MHFLPLGFVYLMFFLSGAAALIYEVVWARSLSLVFGGTHLAVTTVLSVFMGGLALGSHFIGRRVDNIRMPLRLYGILELGIALSAVAFIMLMDIYPTVYAFLVQGMGNSKLYLTTIRIAFSTLALIVPTTLMGGTLPVLTRFASTRPDTLGSRLSLLYGWNTLGAVVGSAAAAFFLLRLYAVSTAMHTAIFINAVIGIAAILLQARAEPPPAARVGMNNPEADTERAMPADESPRAPGNLLPFRVVLFGIAVSGFCALGYEVLWTRILTLTVGTSVYGFAIMLISFLTGIALGSGAYGLLRKALRIDERNATMHILVFGVVQCLIGVTALAVSFFMRDLPANSTQFRYFFLGWGFESFQARQWANMALAFSYMFVPAFFMGLAFPVAGNVQALYRKKIGHAVGDVLSFNTLGAIAGSAVSGFFMIYAFGIERSLQLLTAVNIGLGLFVTFSIRRSPFLRLGAASVTLVALLILIANPGAFRMWDRKYFAIFQNNQPESYDTPEKKQDAIENTDVLYYHEGVDSTISVIKPKGGDQALLVNGKIVASTSLKDQQCQQTLGHLPMLLHRNPRKVLVVGLGTGMTLGAVSVHPNVQELTLAEIEPSVVKAARAFGQYNNHVLDSPRLNVVFSDGRNFLMTTNEKFDVITADPIHPWTQGSGYLYTDEYFRLASEHLLPGGIMCQWLPIYELSVKDLKSVVSTFSSHFKYTMAWLTYYDAEIIGSNSPLLIDEEDLQKRIAHPPVLEDLREVMMGSSEEFLSYFIFGSRGMNAFGQGGIINTDDNLYLEFSTPISVGKNVMGVNVETLASYREDILPYLVPARDPGGRLEQEKRWTANGKAAGVADKAHVLFLEGRQNIPAFLQLMAILEKDYPQYAPARFLELEYKTVVMKNPRLLWSLPLALSDEAGRKVVLQLSAVLAPVSEERGAVVFVDNDAKVIYGQRYFSGAGYESHARGFADGVMSGIEEAYRNATKTALAQGSALPKEKVFVNDIRAVIADKIKDDPVKR